MAWAGRKLGVVLKAVMCRNGMNGFWLFIPLFNFLFLLQDCLQIDENMEMDNQPESAETSKSKDEEEVSVADTSVKVNRIIECKLIHSQLK